MLCVRLTLVNIKHFFKPICAVPCNNVDELCLNSEDEKCESSWFFQTLTLVFIFILVTITCGEIVFRLEYKPSSVEEYPMLNSNSKVGLMDSTGGHLNTTVPKSYTILQNRRMIQFS